MFPRDSEFHGGEVQNMAWAWEWESGFFSGSGKTGNTRGVGKDFPRCANLMVARSQRTRSRVARDVNRRSGRLGPPLYPKYNHTVGVKYSSVAVRSERCKCHH